MAKEDIVKYVQEEYNIRHRGPRRYFSYIPRGSTAVGFLAKEDLVSVVTHTSIGDQEYLTYHGRDNQSPYLTWIDFLKQYAKYVPYSYFNECFALIFGT